MRPAFRAGGGQSRPTREPIAPLESGISDERIGRAPIGKGALYLRLGTHATNRNLLRNGNGLGQVEIAGVFEGFDLNWTPFVGPRVVEFKV